MTTIDEIVKEFEKEFTYGVLLSASSDLSSGTARRYKNEDAEKSIKWLRSQLLSLIGEVEVASEKMKKESESDKPAMLRELSNEFIVGYNSAIKDFLSLIRGMKV